MIKVENLVKKYDGISALNGVSFELKKGEIVGILGPNGAGKTTLLRILVSFIEPTSGNVEIDGLDARNPSYQKKIKSKIGYLPENAPLYEDMTVAEYLKFAADMQEIKKEELSDRVSYVIKKCGLKEKENIEISTLSKGYKQRVGIAQSLVHNPEIVILDEPTTGLDPSQRIEIRNLIKEIGETRTVILSSHILSEVQASCSRILIINKGKIVADGSYKDLEKIKGGKSVISIEVEKLNSNLVSKIKDISGIIDVSVNENRIDITIEKDIDPRKEIAEIAVNEKCGLLELTMKKTNLEDMFMDLTKNNE